MNHKDLAERASRMAMPSSGDDAADQKALLDAALHQLSPVQLSRLVQCAGIRRKASVRNELGSYVYSPPLNSPQTPNDPSLR